MHWEERFRTQAGTQEGILAKFQVPAIGCTPEHWRRARLNGRWEELAPRVLLERGLPPTDQRRALAATLESSPGAMLHAESALAWLGMRTFDLKQILVARPRGLSGAPATLAEVHRLRAFRPHDVVVVGGVATETALRAIWAIAARYATPALLEIGAAKIGNLLDAAHRLDLVTWAALHEMVEDIRQRGRQGTVLMRALAEARPPGSSPTESRQESRLEEVLDRAGARPLRRQPVLGGHEPIGRCDHRDDELPLATETNSLLHHTTPSDREADERRYQRLTTAGFTVGVIWEDDLWSAPKAVVETVALARRHAAAGDKVVVHSPGCPWPLPHFGAPS
jgi:hypothetical protein